MTADADTVSDPHWFPDKLDADAGVIEFVRTDRRALADAPFLDQRFSGRAAQRVRTPLNGLLKATTRPAVPANFIFHTAFCCSTLLARALDYPGANLSLKEPNILMDLANAKRVSQYVKNSPGAWPGLADAVFSLLSRRFAADEPILAKPTNPANNLIPDALAFGGRALLLYSDLRGFLVSVIKKGEACRAFVRNLYNIFSLDPEPLGVIPGRQAMKFTDLQVAALVWRHQMEGFMKALRGPHKDRARTLDCTVLLARPAGTLAALNEFYALGLTADQIGAIAQGPVFSVDSKSTDRGYSADQRAEEAGGIEARHGEALNSILTWAKTLRLGEDLPAAMPNALAVAGEGPPCGTAAPKGAS